MPRANNNREITKREIIATLGIADYRYKMIVWDLSQSLIIQDVAEKWRQENKRTSLSCEKEIASIIDSKIQRFFTPLPAHLTLNILKHSLRAMVTRVRNLWRRHDRKGMFPSIYERGTP